MFEDHLTYMDERGKRTVESVTVNIVETSPRHIKSKIVCTDRGLDPL